MSILFNAAGELVRLASETSLGIGTGVFCVGFWGRAQTTGGFDWSCVGADIPVDFGFWLANGDFPGVYLGPGTVLGDQQLTTNTWYYFVYGRKATNTRFLDIYDDSTSTSPVFTGTVPSDTDNYNALDLVAWGDVSGSGGLDIQIACGRVHIGVAWTGAQARLESQKLTPQTAGGTVFGNYKFETATNDASGYQDSSGAGHHLSATGSISTGANRPSQLESAGGAANVSPGVGALTLTGFAPTALVPRLVSPAAGALTLTGLAPTVTAGAGSGVAVQVQLGQLTLTGLAPNPQLWINMGLAATQSFVAEASSFDVLVNPDVGVLTLTGFAPTLPQTTVVIPNTGALTLNGLVPTITAAVGAAVGLGQLQLVGFAPVVNGATGGRRSAGALMRRARSGWWRTL